MKKTKTKDLACEAYGVFIPFFTKESAEYAKKELTKKGIKYETFVIHLTKNGD